jgi:hypothetical protein
MKTTAVAAIALIFLSGCTEGPREINNYEQATQAIEEAGFECDRLKPATFGFVEQLECQSDKVSGSVVLSFAMTKDLFVDAIAVSCEDEYWLERQSEDVAILGENWTFQLGGDQLKFTPLEDVQKSIGGRVITYGAICSEFSEAAG